MWISTRRAAPAADRIRNNLAGQYLLEEVLSSVDAPLQEMHSADVVAMELPPISRTGFEHRVFDAVSKLQAASLEILLLVQPCLRRKSSKSTWTYRWNRMAKTQCKFRQSCSCKLGSSNPGFHAMCYVASSQDLGIEACPEMPKTSQRRKELSTVLVVSFVT